MPSAMATNPSINPTDVTEGFDKVVNWAVQEMLEGQIQGQIDKDLTSGIREALEATYHICAKYIEYNGFNPTHIFALRAQVLEDRKQEGEFSWIEEFEREIAWSKAPDAILQGSLFVQ